MVGRCPRPRGQHATALRQMVVSKYWNSALYDSDGDGTPDPPAPNTIFPTDPIPDLINSDPGEPGAPHTGHLPRESDPANPGELLPVMTYYIFVFWDWCGEKERLFPVSGPGHYGDDVQEAIDDLWDTILEFLDFSNN